MVQKARSLGVQVDNSLDLKERIKAIKNCKMELVECLQTALLMPLVSHLQELRVDEHI